jgi:ribosome-binding protein aMBF1 (putative translation factor)
MSKVPKLASKHVRRVDLDAWIERERRTSPEFQKAYEEARAATWTARALAELRQRRGLSQKEVAQRLGTSQAAVSRMERADYTGHTLRLVRRYVEVLGARLEVRIVDDAAA